MTLRAFAATVVKPMATRSLDRILTLEYHDTSPSGKNQMGLLVVKIGIGSLQILERLLQGVHRCIGQPCRFLAVAPFGE